MHLMDKLFVINLYSISSFDNGTATLTNGEIARIGRSKIGEFKRIYKQFLKDYYGKLNTEKIVSEFSDDLMNRGPGEFFGEKQSGSMNFKFADLRSDNQILLKANEEYKSVLKTEGLLTRDARVKERKKYGLKKARRAPQFSKR